MSALDILTIRARYLANAPAGVLTIFDNQPNVTPEKGKPFIRHSIRPGASNRESTGPHPFERQQGRVNCSIFVPRGDGDALAYDLADQCAAIYRNWQWRSGEDGINADTPEITVIDTEEDWFQVKVSIYWESWHRT